MPAEEGDLVGRAALLVDGDNGESATSAGFPVDCDVFGVGLGGVSASFLRSRARWADLDQVGVPGVFGDAQVVIALLLWGR